MNFLVLKANLSKVTHAPRLSIGGYVNTLGKAQETGKISFQREDILFFETDRMGEFIVNTTRVINAGSYRSGGFNPS